MKSLEMSDEGFTPSEIKEVISPFTENAPPKRVVAQKSKAPIQSPALNQGMFESDDEDEVIQNVAVAVDKTLGS